MSDLEILLCGPPEIHHHHQPFTLSRRTMRALLFYLGSQGGLVSRGQLLPLFWENEPDNTARRRLTDTISRLRASLPDAKLITVDTSLVGLDFNRVYVDQIEFQDLLDRAGRIPWQIPQHEPLPEHTHHLLNRAASLWRGSRFLSGARFPSSAALDHWLTHTSERMEHQNARILERLANHAQAMGSLEEALALTRFSLQHDELNEDANIRLIQLLIDLGLYHQAHDHYERVRSLLRRELDIDPPSRLTALVQQIREDGVSINLADTAPVWKLRPTVDAPFVGRRQILDQLNRALMNGGGICITGESGQGKSRLLKEFTQRIKPTPRIMVTTCRPAESSLPFQPIIELLRYHVTKDEWRSFPVIWASQLTLLLPDLNEIRSDLGKPIFEPGAETAHGRARASIMEAVRQIFIQLSRQSRLVICLDDIQWSDEATLATIGYLIERQPFDRNALFLTAARLEESNPYLDAILGSMRQSGRCSTIPLARMSDNEISELTSHVTKQMPSETVIRQLSRETGGNPFILLESLRSLMESDPGYDLTRIASLPVTEGIQNLVKTRLEKLTPAAYSLMEVASVLGTDFDPEILVEVSQQPGLQVAAVLQELEKRALIVVADRSVTTPKYSFSHDKIREILLQTINPLRVRHLYRAAAQAMVKRSQRDDQASIIANHFELSGELLQAFDCWTRAIRYAHRLYATADAHWIFSRAESLIARVPTLTDRQILSLYTEWTEIAYETEDVLTLQRISTDLLRLGRERNSSLLIGAALDGLSDACMVSNQFEEGLAYTDQAISYLGNGDSPFNWMQAYNHRGTFLYMLNRIDDAIELFQDALTIGADSHDSQLLQPRGNAHYQIAIASLLAGYPEIARAHARRSLNDFLAANHYHGQITAYSALSISHYFLGEYQQAARESQTGIEMARHSLAWRMLGYLHMYRGNIEIALGNLDAAVEHANQAIELGERYRHNEIEATGHRLLGDIFFWLQAPQDSIPYFRRAVETSQDKFLSMDSRFRLITAQVLSGADEKAEDQLTEYLTFMQQAGLGAIHMMARLSRLSIAYQKKDWQAVQSLGTQLHEDAGQRSLKSIRLTTANILSDRLITRGDLAAGLAAARHTALEAMEMGHPWIEISARLLIHRAEQALKQAEPSQKPHIQDLLRTLDGNVTQQPYRQAFLRYRERIMREFSHTLPTSSGIFKNIY